MVSGDLVVPRDETERSVLPHPEGPSSVNSSLSLISKRDGVDGEHGAEPLAQLVDGDVRCAPHPAGSHGEVRVGAGLTASSEARAREPCSGPGGSARTEDGPNVPLREPLGIVVGSASAAARGRHRGGRRRATRYDPACPSSSRGPCRGPASGRRGSSPPTAVEWQSSGAHPDEVGRPSGRRGCGTPRSAPTGPADSLGLHQARSWRIGDPGHGRAAAVGQRTVLAPRHGLPDGLWDP